VKIHAAYHAAAHHRGQPTVILAQTKKGYGMGTAGQGKMTTHQQKKLDDEALLAFRDRFALPLSDEQASALSSPARRRQPRDALPARAPRRRWAGYLPRADRLRRRCRCRPRTPTWGSFALERRRQGDEHDDGLRAHARPRC
jgi:pyruvate dehydrogenase E1 component